MYELVLESFWQFECFDIDDDDDDDVDKWSFSVLISSTDDTGFRLNIFWELQWSKFEKNMT